MPLVCDVAESEMDDMSCDGRRVKAGAPYGSGVAEAGRGVAMIGDEMPVM